jgi:hypothetical protein
MQRLLNKQTIAIVLLTAVVIALLCLLFNITVRATDEEGKAECQKWEMQSKQFPGFYVTTWQKQQCDFYKMPVDAPVQ